MSQKMIHETAIVDEGAKIGEGTRIWHWTHVRGTAKIGKNCNIGQNVYIDDGVTIGDNCKIQNGVNVYKGVTIGNGVFVGPGVQFTNDKYPKAEYWDDGLIRPTVVKDGASIGANATIVCGIIIGERSLIGAGSVVTRNVPEGKTVMGNPAREPVTAEEFMG